MGLREIESSLPPGFRFHPSDEELVCHYLNQKVSNQRGSQVTMVEVDLHILEPWELPEVARLSAHEWYFFTFRDRKYATGSRTNRATKSGYWKATGKDRIIHDPISNMIVGMRKTLVFYHGRAPNGIKSGWVMHEFRLETPNSPPKEDWVLCRVFHKRSREADQEGHIMNGSSSPALMRPSLEGKKSMPNPSPDQQMNSAILFPTISHQVQLDNNTSSNPYMNLALVQCNFLDMAQDIESSIMPMMDHMISNCEDQECRLFLDNDFDIQEHYCMASL